MPQGYAMCTWTRRRTWTWPAMWFSTPRSSTPPSATPWRPSWWIPRSRRSSSPGWSRCSGRRAWRSAETDARRASSTRSRPRMRIGTPSTAISSSPSMSWIPWRRLSRSSTPTDRITPMRSSHRTCPVPPDSSPEWIPRTCSSTPPPASPTDTATGRVRRSASAPTRSMPADRWAWRA